MGDQDSAGDGITDHVPEDAESTLSPEDKLQNADDEELLREYYDTVHHLGVCDAEGQIDNQQQNWEGVLFQEILSRMDEDYEPTY
ncbi:hypothetical protein HZS55_12895 [Halosimplex rubrum]|uniref:Uncharacterized protein n=1 Tax=Halosimplex rubrum TaxID=869889 RepID=A0A7D5P5H7_9EURY|nr:hypothetical protein [Halosimplex rubrum]QLH78145.1 hypothetical protein HZS55_12895 [Halosimplex rubrum]